MAAKLIGPDNATCDHASGSVKPRAVRLDARTSLALVEHPCGNGAYNLFTSVYLVSETGKVRPAEFDVSVGFSETRDNQLVNGDWDGIKRRLSDFARARGLGDCGGRGEYVWDGIRFRLVHQEVMGECRGSVDYITTWRAAVTTAR
jgi:hypothetical protein